MRLERRPPFRGRSPRPSLFESDSEKVRPRKWPGFTPPRATALCRRSLAYYCSAAYSSKLSWLIREARASPLAHAPIGSALTHDNRSLYPGARTVDDGKMIEQRPKARFFLDNSKGVDALDQSTTSESRKMQSLTAVNLSSKPWWDFARIDTLR
jgi:hypothetical protein